MSWDICGHTLHRGGDAKVLNHYASSGHLLLASDYAEFVINRIIRWIEALPQIRSHSS